MIDAAIDEADENQIKVLVVDDRPGNLFAMKRILEVLPVKTITAGSGNDALRETLHHDFAVVLLDVQMPEMDGFETAALIRDNEKTKNLPIIFVTAISKEERYVFKGYESGAVDYLFKPIDSTILLAKTRVFTELARANHALARAHVQLKKEMKERERVEAELRLAQKLKAIGRLASGIAHEINTPVQFIGDNAYFLGTAFEGLQTLLEEFSTLLTVVKDGQPCQEQVEAVERAVEDVELEYLSKHIPRAIEQTQEGIGMISKIVLAMKDFSHPGYEKKGPVDINHALESTITVARNEWKYIAEMECDLDSTIPLVSGLGAELNQVFLNILVNAAHAIRDMVADGANGKGTIRVSTRGNSSYVEIRIADTGSGIPESIRDRIFDPFFTTKEVGRGTGQGLAIARSVVVDKHDGEISVETENGQGTTFIIHLPADTLKAAS